MSNMKKEEDVQSICKCPKCGCEIEMVTVTRGYIKRLPLVKGQKQRYARVSGVHKFREKKTTFYVSVPEKRKPTKRWKW